VLNGTDTLITGATGSFGTKFLEIALRDYTPRRVIAFSRDELKQSLLAARFGDDPGSPLRLFLGDVRDLARLKRAFAGVDTVVHAAALKQVPACEYNPREAVQTNVVGAMNVIEAALDCGVKRVIALSTDKCCQPVNLYGATKLVAEKMFIQANSYRGHGQTRFACVRYGNVANSRGSVIPIFREQSKCGHLTITHEGMTRFLLTLDQGVRFVLSCLDRMVGGEVFVPKLGAIPIVDLARAIAPDAYLTYTGIRPGEKLHEAMVAPGEARQTIDLGDRYAILPAHSWWSDGCYADLPRMPEGWSYTSDTAERLTPEQLREMVNV
jgi:UDP-N-acetylglucosamine 4,6-dehydratase/5-epimerase